MAISHPPYMERTTQLTISPRKQRKIIKLPPLLQEMINLLSRRCPLQHLPIQLLLFHFRNANATFHAHLRAPEISAATATRDQVCHARTLLRKRSRTDGVFEEHLAEFTHLEKTDSHDSSFSVIAPLLADSKAGSESDDVFECTTE